MMDDVNYAIVLFTGWGTHSYPIKDESSVSHEFGKEKADEILLEIDKIMQEMGRIEPDWEKHDLVSASDFAVSIIKLSRNWIDQKASDALKWTYSWWWK